MTVELNHDLRRAAESPGDSIGDREAGGPIDRRGAAVGSAIRIRGFCKSFHGHLGIGRKPAVRGLDLDVHRGEILGLLGPNGAGKTTTLKTLLGLLRPDRGTLELLGRPPHDPAARARVGFLPENPYFYDYLSAAEFLDFYARLHGVPSGERRDCVARALRRVGLESQERVALRKFSKGMLQRVGLAQAIQHDPDLLILDEPMSGLDPIGRRDVRDLILSLRAAGKTVLFSSHILEDVEMICDRVAIVVAGRLRAVGRLDELVQGGARWFEVSVRGLAAGSLPGTPLSTHGEHVLLRVDDIETLHGVLASAREQQGEVTSVFARRHTLEDLFLEEIGREEPS